MKSTGKLRNQFGLALASLCTIGLIGCSGDSPKEPAKKKTQSTSQLSTSASTNPDPVGGHQPLQTKPVKSADQNPAFPSSNPASSSSENASLFAASPGKLPGAKPFLKTDDQRIQPISSLPSTQPVALNKGQDFQIDQVSFLEEAIETANAQENLESLSDEQLLEKKPVKWLERKLALAIKHGSGDDLDLEIKTLSEIVSAFEAKKVTAPWVHTSVALNLKLAKLKKDWSDEAWKKWKRFQMLESDLMNLRQQLNRMRAQNEAETEPYQRKLGLVYTKLESQLQELDSLGLINSHMSGNIFYQAALTSYARKDFKNALGLAKKSLTVRQVQTGHHPDTVASLKLCASAANKLKNDSEATDFYFNAVNLSREVWGADHLETADIANQFGLFLMEAVSKKPNRTKADYKFSKVWMEEAVRIRAAQLGTDHVNYGIALRNLGRLQYILGSLDTNNLGLDKQAAESSFEQVFDIFIKNKVPTSVLNELILEYSSAKASLGKNDHAERLLGQVIRSFDKGFDKNSLSIPAAKVYYRWALTLLRQKNPAQLAEGKRRLTITESLCSTDPRSNTPEFKKLVQGALARVAQLEKK